MPAVDDALGWLVELAESGPHAAEVAAEAQRVAAGWWFLASGDAGGGRLERLVAELRCWCAVAASHYALRRDELHRAGRPREAERAMRSAVAMDRAHQAIAAVCGTGR